MMIYILSSLKELKEEEKEVGAEEDEDEDEDSREKKDVRFIS